MDEAVAEYREAIRLKPDHAEAHYNLGAPCATQGQLEAAERRIPRGHPPQARPRRGPQQPRRRPGRPGEAGRGHRRIPRGHPARARLRRGPHRPRCDPVRQGKLDPGAEAEFREAIRLKPNDVEAHYNLRNALRRQGKREEALAALRRAAELAPPGSPLAAAVCRDGSDELEAQVRLAGRLPGSSTARISPPAPPRP